MKRYLIIEDEFIIAKDLELLLKKNNASYVSIARNYQQAIDAFAPGAFDIIICDINLKDKKDGIETITHLMKKGSVPVVYLTAYDDPSIVRRAMKTMPFAYLIKPYNESQLLITIDLALINYKKHQENIVATLDHSKQIESLTKREKEILVTLASGKTSKETGEYLCISRHTVDQHKKNIKQKLDLNTLGELIKFTMTANLLQVS